MHLNIYAVGKCQLRVVVIMNVLALPIRKAPTQQGIELTQCMSSLIQISVIQIIQILYALWFRSGHLLRQYANSKLMC